MLHKKIRIPIESSQEIMEELGKLDDCLQFVDINIGDYNHKKAYEDYIKRCDECLKEINYFENIVFLYFSIFSSKSFLFLIISSSFKSKYIDIFFL